MDYRTSFSLHVVFLDMLIFQVGGTWAVSRDDKLVWDVVGFTQATCVEALEFWSAGMLGCCCVVVVGALWYWGVGVSSCLGVGIMGALWTICVTFGAVGTV